MNRYRTGFLITAFFTLSLAGGAIGAAGFDRLKDWVKIGQGAAGTKDLEFDSGNGTSNARVRSTASTDLSLATGGTTRLAASSTGVSVTGNTSSSSAFRAPAGSASTPSYSFTGETNTGLHFQSTGNIGVDALGSNVGQMASDGVFWGNGSAAIPAYSFLSDADTGMYHYTTNTLGFASGGVNSLILEPNAASFKDGSVSLPSVTFASDQDSGMYHYGTNAVGIAANGIMSAVFESGGILAGAGYATEASSNGYIKWKVFTGSLSGGASATLSGPGSLVLAVIGMSTFNGSAGYGPMQTVENSGSFGSTIGGVIFSQDDAVSNGAIIKNYDSNSTNNYRVTMFYQ